MEIVSKQAAQEFHLEI